MRFTKDLNEAYVDVESAGINLARPSLASLLRAAHLSKCAGCVIEPEGGDTSSAGARLGSSRSLVERRSEIGTKSLFGAGHATSRSNVPCA
jgi:hypothetical protein